MLPFLIYADMETGAALADALVRCCRKAGVPWQIIAQTDSAEEGMRYLSREERTCVVLLKVVLQRDAIKKALSFVELSRQREQPHVLLPVLDRLRILELLVNHGAMPAGVISLPLNAQQADSVLERVVYASALKADNQNECVAVLSVGRTVIRLPMSSVIYIEALEKKVDIYTRGQRFTVCDSLKSVASKLDGRFWQCHRSCVVNCDCVSMVDFAGMSLCLTNGAVVPLARSARDEARRRFLFGDDQIR